MLNRIKKNAINRKTSNKIIVLKMFNRKSKDNEMESRKI